MSIEKISILNVHPTPLYVFLANSSTSIYTYIVWQCVHCTVCVPLHCVTMCTLYTYPYIMVIFPKNKIMFRQNKILNEPNVISWEPNKYKTHIWPLRGFVLRSPLGAMCDLFLFCYSSCGQRLRDGLPLEDAI